MREVFVYEQGDQVVTRNADGALLVWKVGSKGWLILEHPVQPPPLPD